MLVTGGVVGPQPRIGGNGGGFGNGDPLAAVEAQTLVAGTGVAAPHFDVHFGAHGTLQIVDSYAVDLVGKFLGAGRRGIGIGDALPANGAPEVLAKDIAGSGVGAQRRRGGTQNQNTASHL